MFRLYCLMCLIALSSLLYSDRLPKLVYLNFTDSVPQGLYVRTISQEIAKGSMVISKIPEDIEPLPRIRGYISGNLSIQKKVAAMYGDLVCRTDAEILINDKVVAKVRISDSLGRPLPIWQGCAILKKDEVFLLANHQKSFDSRYFGPVKRHDITSVVTAVWTVPINYP